jgi:hypothetical protein
MRICFFLPCVSDNSECCGDIKSKKKTIISVKCCVIQREWVRVTGYLLSESLLLLQDSELHLLSVHGFLKRVLCLFACLSVSFLLYHMRIYMTVSNSVGSI